MNTVAEWLESIGLAKYVDVFEENEITLDVVPHLTEADVRDLGLPMGPRRKLVVAIQAMATAAAAPEPVAVEQEEALPHGVERRQLTVMFCDLVGSTALAERLDPEELRELMQAYRAVSGDVIARYSGYVAQYLGDGLMVYFGWPVAHEDDADRGVRSALEVVEAVRGLGGAETLQVRIGLATGPVVVGGADFEDNAEARLAVGETPNLAARLQGLAGIDEVVIAAATRRLVGDAYTLTDMGPRDLKGIAEPVRAWRVEAVRRTEGRFEAAHAGMELTPLIGRDDELAELLLRWQQSHAGEGRVVSIGGEPGIGKSRLTQALRDGIREAHTVLRYQCTPYHTNSALHPFIDQFEAAAGFVRDDTPEQRLDKLEAQLIGAPEHVTELAPLFAAVLSLPTDRYPPLLLSPEKQKERTVEALVGQIEARARRGPLLILVEDLHWIDPTSQEVLAVVVPRVRHLPVLFVGTYRLEYLPPWAEMDALTTLTLRRLGRDQGARIVAEITAGRALPDELLEEILARTDGVPLFVEELTKTLLESGALRAEGDTYVLDAPLETLAIPTSLRDSLMARLDRLGPVKTIAQIGACIGREFSYELLVCVSTLSGPALQAALERLVEAGMVLCTDAPPSATYMFKHALVQDAAYDSLLRKTRSHLHARIAGALEARFADSVSSKPEWLAHHHTQAGSLAAAIPLWRDAGVLAVGRVALQEALAHFQRGLDLIDQEPASPDRDRLELSIREPLSAAWTGLRGWAASEVGANAEEILRLARSMGETQSVLLAMWWMWTTTITQGRIADSDTWVQRLIAEGSETDDIDLKSFGHATAMVQQFLHGDLVLARENVDRALELYDPARAARWLQLTGHDQRTFVEVYACQLIWMLGYPDTAVRVADRSSAHAHADGHAFNLVWALTFSSYTFAYRREPERFLERVREADALAREQGIAFISQVSVPQAKGLARLLDGRPAEARPFLEAGIEGWTSRGGHVRVPYLKAALAEAAALEGDFGEALRLIDECVAQIERPECQERVWLPEVLRLKGWMFTLLGRDDDAETLLRASVACAREQHARSWELRSATTLATLLVRRGRNDDARAVLAPVHAWFTEGFDTQDLLDARAVLDAIGD